MKWFQQNRALGILLLSAGGAILLCAVLLYWRWSVWGDAKQTFDQAASERNRLQGLNPYPDNANYKKLQGYLEKYKTALDKFKDDLKSEVAPDPPLAPNEFQSRLRQTTLAVQERARTNNVRLPDNFQLGFDEFARMMPGTTVAPLLGQELSQTQMLVNVLLDAKVDSITSFHRHPLAEERGATSTPTPPPGRAAARPGATPTPKLIERNVVEVSFKAAPSAARKVLNEITNSASQFFIIRTLYVHNEKDKGPPHERTASPTPAPAPNPQASPGQQAPGALNFIVGNEHIEVSATIEMLRFTF